MSGFVRMSFINWKSQCLLLRTVICWLHRTFSGSTLCLAKVSGMLGFFSPVNVLRVTSVKETLPKSGFLSRGIGSLDVLHGVCVCWTSMVAREWVYFNPFCVQRFASKLSDTPWIKPRSLFKLWSFLLVVKFAAEILNLLTSSYEQVTPFSWSCWITFLSWKNN